VVASLAPDAVALLIAPEDAAFLWFLAALLIVAGLFVTVLPGHLPGTPFVCAGLFAAAAADDFQRVGAWTLVPITFLAALALALEIWISLRAPRRLGGSWLAAVGAAVGTVVGFFFGLPGIVIGPFLGAFAGEIAVRRNLREASRAGLSAWWVLLLVYALRAVAVAMMLGLFALSYVT
jgi:uncharacterized protein YqgC (DUF456 family)